MSANLETVRSIYESFGKGDVPAILARLSEDVQWDHDLDGHGIPWLTPLRGRASVSRFFEALAGLDFRLFAPQTLVEGGAHVASVIGVEMVVKATGRTIKDRIVHLWTFDQSGAVSAFRHFVDTHQHYVALTGDAAVSSARQG